MDILRPFFAKHLEGISLIPDIKFSSYNQYVQDILDTNSRLYSFDPHYVIIFIDGDELFGDEKHSLFLKGPAYVESAANEKITHLKELLASVRTRLNAKFLLNTIILNPGNCYSMLEANSKDKSFTACENIYNSTLSGLADDQIFIVDFRNACAVSGYKTLFDQRLWYVGRIKLSQVGMEELTKLYASYIKAIEGKTKKCIILDLDNTLWGGVIGEDGIEGIKLARDGIGMAFVDFQEQLIQISKQGVLLAINSKNNFNDIKEVFTKHPDMVLTLDDFSCVRINWNDKISNMIEISEELNIGLDSFVFIDDSPFERHLVKKELPMVSVPDFPDDPAFLRDWLTEIYRQFFPRIKLSREDVERTRMYRAQAQRTHLRKNLKNIEDFLESLDMKARIYINPKGLIQRMAQLTQRTNQFNVMTNRYSESDIQSFMEKGNIIFALELSDRFGSNGVVGLIMIDTQGRTFLINNFLLSCRVIGREVEKTFIGFVIHWLGKQNFKQNLLCGKYIPTKRNTLVKDIYAQLGFKFSDMDTWIWDMRNAYSIPKFIEIQEVIPNDRESKVSNI
jgi:FkbH-like protein